MDEFKPQSLPDPIIIPGKASPPSVPPVGSDFPSKNRLGAVEFLANNKWYVVAILAGLGIIGALLFFALRPQNDKLLKEADVRVEIGAPESAPSGGEVVYKVKITNNDPSQLVDMELEMVYPDGVSYISSTPKPENLSGSRFKIPNLTTGQNAVVIVKTVAQGNVNDEKKLNAKLRYRLSNFNSVFVKESFHTVRLVAADVILDMTGPENATNSEVLSYQVFYRNNSKRDIDNSRLRVTYPEGFVFADATPKPSMEQHTWSIGTLKSGGTGKISFKGAFKSSNPGQAATFKVEFEVTDDAGKYYTQGSTSFSTAIASEPLIVQQKLTSVSSNGIAKPGDTVSYDITFQNNNSVVATGVTIVAQLDSRVLDLASIKAESGEIKDNTITWNGSSVPSLSRLNPNEKGSIRLTVKINNPAVKEADKELTIVSKVKIKSNEAPTFLSAPDLTVKISSPSSIKGLVNYVSGQLPPKVGQPSVFRVTMELRNATNDYREGVVTGFIPVGVTMEPGTVTTKEQAQVKYDASTGKVTWNVGLLEANSGTFEPVRTMSFDVKFTPSVAQRGKAVELFKNIVFTGKDTFTGQIITLNTTPMATDTLQGKPSQQGRVIE